MNRFKFIAAFIGFHSLHAAEAPAAVKVGDKAPDFTLTNSSDKEVSLSDYEGKNIVLIFSRAHW